MTTRTSALAASLVIAATLTTNAYADSTSIKSASTIATTTVPIAALSAPPTTPAEIVTIAPASPTFQGWVHMTLQKPPAPDATLVTSTNTVTGASFTVQKSPKDTHISYRNSKTDESVDYHSSTDLIRIGLVNPDSKERQAENAALPISYAAVIANLRPLLGHEPIGITHTTDQGLDRYDFTAPRDAAKKILQAQGNDPNATDNFLYGIPTAIWIDPATHLTQRALIYNDTATYTYGGPDISSIYDACAPKTAKVYDNRPTPDTLAALERVHKRISTPLPDGVSVILYESENYTSMTVYEQSKNHWIQRSYSIRAPKPNDYTIDLPADWATTGVDEFFHRLAVTGSEFEYLGSPTDVYFRDFTPYTPAETQPKIYPDGSSMTTITREHHTGRAVKSSTLLLSPQYYLFAIHASGQYDTVNHASLITDPNRPGLIAIRDELRRDTPDSLRGVDDYWIDPAHGDRLVQHVEESFEDPPTNPQNSALLSSTGRYRSITDYSGYATLPDGREYATHSTTTDYTPTRRGRFIPSATRSATFHFFPNRTLPPLKIPATQPANLP